MNSGLNNLQKRTGFYARFATHIAFVTNMKMKLTIIFIDYKLTHC